MIWKLIGWISLAGNGIFMMINVLAYSISRDPYDAFFAVFAFIGMSGAGFGLALYQEEGK